MSPISAFYVIVSIEWSLKTSLDLQLSPLYKATLFSGQIVDVLR